MSTSADDQADRSYTEELRTADPSTSGGATSGRLLSDFEASTEPIEPEPRTRWHLGLDFGLLILRLALGAIMVGHGLQKFHFFGGAGMDGFSATLQTYGFTQSTSLLSWITAAVEVGAGGLLVLGVFTPLGLAGLLTIQASVIAVKLNDGFFLGAPTQGFEYEVVLAAIAVALLFTGPGRISLDANTPWRRKPVPFGLVALLLAAAATVTMLLVFR